MPFGESNRIPRRALGGQLQPGLPNRLANQEFVRRRSVALPFLPFVEGNEQSQTCRQLGDVVPDVLEGSRVHVDEPVVTRRFGDRQVWIDTVDTHEVDDVG